MSILFASGDVGGARALFPVIEECDRRDIPFVVLDHGWISEHLSESWRRARLLDSEKEGNLIRSTGARAVVFSSSVDDAVALRLARQAKAMGLPVIHVLDHWTSYRRRVEMDGAEPLQCDVYAVMDKYAAKAAEAEGIDRGAIVVTGHPAFASLALERAGWHKRNRCEELIRFGLDPNKKALMFVSEPAEHDQGATTESPRFRGYTEKSVLASFCNAAESFADEIDVGVLAHPREDASEVEASWERHKGKGRGRVMKVRNGREVLFAADGIVGMASMLLYEAWLVGRRTISLQPGLRMEELRTFANRDGMVLVDSEESLKSQFELWMKGVSRGAEAIPQMELELHRNAAGNVVERIECCLRK